MRDFQGPEWQHAAHQRFRHEKGYTAAERLALVEWYFGRANRLLYKLTDAANFTEGTTRRGPPRIQRCVEKTVRGLFFRKSW